MVIVIHGRKVAENSLHYVKLIFDKLISEDSTIFLSDIFEEQNSEHLQGYNFRVFSNQIPKETDAVFSLGGDGTMLETISMIGPIETPVLGINTGRLGFLATIAKDQISSALTEFFKGAYKIEQRSLLQLKTEDNMFGAQSFALNEFSILRRETSSMIVVKVFMNGEYLNTYWADGLMVATPTGSTGYSLSCGGPILDPATRNFVITPVSPHNLNARPFIVPDSSELTFVVDSRKTNYLVSLDSRSLRVEDENQIKVSKATFSARLIKLNEDSFIKTLKNKLSWGLDVRN